MCRRSDLALGNLSWFHGYTPLNKSQLPCRRNSSLRRRNVTLGTQNSVKNQAHGKIALLKAAVSRGGGNQLKETIRGLAHRVEGRFELSTAATAGKQADGPGKRRGASGVDHAALGSASTHAPRNGPFPSS